MGNVRAVLLISLAFLGYLLWVEWQKDYGTPARPARSAPAESVSDAPANVDVPEPIEAPAATPASEALPAAAGEQPPASSRVTVTTDVLEVSIDTLGGTVVGASLLDYPVDLAEPERKVNLLRNDGEGMFVAQSGLVSRQAAANHTTPYQAEALRYQLTEGADELRVPLSWSSPEGIQVTKTFVFRRGRFDIDVSHHVRNASSTVWAGSRYEQLQQAVSDDEEKGGFNNPEAYSFRGIGFYSPQDKFEKIDFEDVADEPYEKTFSGGWLAMIQHYFFAAWIPPADEAASFSTQRLVPVGETPRYIARGVSPAVSIQPGGEFDFASRLYLGPKQQKKLEAVAPGLEHTVNYGIFTVFSKPLFWLLSKIHDVVGNWGWAIVLLTILIKGAFFKLTEAQYRSMARMRKLQPRIEQLKERYGDDRQRMSQAMMEMYKTEKVNPLGGCLPILVQIPIFIALYWVLLESVELRQAPFVGWIDNLSVRDPYFILPAFNAVFMIITQRLTPMAGMDPLQRKMMNLMPVVFAVMFAFFPAGLVLYWATNAGLSLAQQLYITRKIAGSEK